MYTTTTTLALDPSYAGASLRIQYYEYDSINDERDAVGTPVATGIFELPGGDGLFAIVLVVQDNLTGWADIYDNADAGTILASVPLNPQELETNSVVAAELITYGALTPTVAGRTLDVNAAGEAGIDLDNTSGTLAKGTDITGFNDIDSTQVNAEVDQALADYDAPTFAELDTRTDAIDAAIAAIQSDTNDLQTQIGTAGAGLTDIPGIGGDGMFEFTYTVTSSTTFQPIPGVAIRITSDLAGLNTIWTGTTDALGIARNACGDKPRLSAGTIYLWRTLSGYQFSDPDTEVIS